MAFMRITSLNQCFQSGFAVSNW